MLEGKLLIDSSLDDLREGYCLALIPRDPDVSLDRLLGIEGCVGGRVRSEAVRAVFRLDPAACEEVLARELGAVGARCATVGLEEIFIELAGGDS